MHFFNLEIVFAIASQLNSGLILPVRRAIASMLDMCPLDACFRYLKVFVGAMQKFQVNIWLFGGIFAFNFWNERGFGFFFEFKLVWLKFCQSGTVPP